MLTHQRRARKLLSALSLAALLLCLLATTALSHAELVSSSPANAEQLPVPPAEISLFFSEGVQTGQITLFDNAGAQLPLASPMLMPGDPRTIIADTPSLDEGIYTVRWQMLAEDGHTTSGSFFFVVGDQIPTRAQFLTLLTDQTGAGAHVLQPLEPVARGILFLALALLLGIPITWWGVISPAQQRTGVFLGSTANRTLRRVLLATAGAMLIGTLLLALAQFMSVTGSFALDRIAGFIRETAGGGSAGIRLLVALLLFTGLLLTRERILWLAMAGGAGFLLTLSLNQSSHTVSLMGSRINGYAFLVDFAHLLAVGVWVGGLGLLLWLVTSAGSDYAGSNKTEENDATTDRSHESRGRLVATAVARFSILALACVTLGIATGLLLASWFVPTWHALVETLYGSVLSAKLGVLLLAIGLGAFHRYSIVRRLPQTGADANQLARFGRSLRAEVAAVAGIMFLSGLLTATAPAISSTPQAEESHEHEFVGEMGQRPLHLRVTPFQVGLNVFDIDLGADSPPLENATLLLRLPAQEVELPMLELTQVEAGLWSAVGAIPMAGEWQIRASAFVDGSFQAARFAVALGSAHETHDHAHDNGHDHAHDDTASPATLHAAGDPGFRLTLQLGAAFVALGGLLMLVYDVRSYRRSYRSAR